MLANQNNFTFKSENRTYSLLVRLYTSAAEVNNSKNALDIGDIKEFTYTSELNDLLIHGTLRYTDKYAVIDSFKRYQYQYCHVMFAQNTSKTDS